MKRRSLLQRAAQVLGGAAAALLVKEAPASPATQSLPPDRGPARVASTAWEKAYRHETMAMGMRVQSSMEEDLYGIYAQFARELGKTGTYTQELQAMSIFGVKP